MLYCYSISGACFTLFAAWFILASSTSVDGRLCGSLNRNAERAIHRATTSACKRELESIACLAKSERLFSSIKLRSSCPLDDSLTFGQLVGCFEHDAKSLPVFQTANQKSFEADGNSPKQCLQHCLRTGQQLAAVTGSWCSCGQWRQLRNESRLRVSRCFEEPCSGNTAQACGSWNTALVYNTGLHSPKSSSTVKLIELKNWTAVEPKNHPKILFLLILNGRQIRQVVRMLNLIWDPHHYFYIHVDQNQPLMSKALEYIERIVENVKLKRNRFSSTWGGPGLLHVFLDSIRDVLEVLPNWNWDFVINLSESDFPILSVEELALFLNEHRGKNFVAVDDSILETQPAEDLFYSCDDHLWLVDKRTLPNGVRTAAGSSWATLSREFAEFIVLEQDPLVKSLLRYHNYSAMALQTFLHTVLLNSRFCETHEATNLRLEVQRRQATSGCECQEQTFADTCVFSTSVIKMSDSELLERDTARDDAYVFGRQFDPTVTQVAVFGTEDGVLQFYTDNKKALVTWFKRYDNATIQLRDHGVPGAHAFRQNIPGFHGHWLNLFHVTEPVSDQMKPTVALVNALARISHQSLQTHGSFHQPAFYAFQTSLKDPCVDFNNWELMPLELTLYRHLDHKSRLLILYRATCEDRQRRISIAENIEVALQRVPNRRTFQEKRDHRLDDFGVGTSYDKSERFFRNFAGVITTDDRPSLRLEFVKAGRQYPKQLNITVRWLDPRRKVRGDTFLVIPEGFTVVNVPFADNAKSAAADENLNKTAVELYPPLHPPGKWTVEIGEFLHEVVSGADANSTSELPQDAEIFQVLPQQNTTEIRRHRKLAEMEFAVIPADQDLSSLKEPLLRLWEQSVDGHDRFLEPVKPVLSYSKLTADFMTDSILAPFYKPLSVCFITDALLGYDPQSQGSSSHDPRFQGSAGQCPSSGRRYLTLMDCSEIHFSSRFPDPKAQFNPNLKIDI